MDTVANPPTTTQRGVTDISPRAVSLAREIDRLPPGDYLIRLVKPDNKQSPMHANVERTAAQLPPHVVTTPAV